VVIVDNLYNSSDEVLNRIELICGKRPEYEKLDITDEKALDAVFANTPTSTMSSTLLPSKLSESLPRSLSTITM